MSQLRKTITFEVIEVRDDDIIEGLETSLIPISVICREALRMYFGRDDKVLDRLDELVEVMQGQGGAISAPPIAPARSNNNNPFSDTEL